MSEALTSATPRSSARSCRRGCLLMLAMMAAGLTLAVIGAWLGWVTFARPWLEQRQAQLVRDYPLVRTAWSYLTGGEIRISSKAISIREEAKGRRDRADFPGDVYVPEGAERSAFRSEGINGLAVLTYSRTEPAQAVSECRGEMGRRGWKVLKTSDPPEGKRLFFTKSNRTAEFLFLSRGAGLRLWIQVGGKVNASSLRE